MTDTPPLPPPGMQPPPLGGPPRPGSIPSEPGGSASPGFAPPGAVTSAIGNPAGSPADAHGQPPPPSGPASTIASGAVPPSMLPPALRQPTVAIGLQPLQTEAELKAARILDREALRRLAAAPEIMASGVIVLAAIALIGTGTFLQWLVLATFVTVVFSLFAYLALRGGDGVLLALVCVAGALMVALAIGVRFEPDGTTIWWLIPPILLIFFENAFTYNNYRRRHGDITPPITRTHWENLAAVVIGSIVFAAILRWFATKDRLVNWQWFGAVVVLLVAGTIASLVTLRRRAVPADRRRFTPGRRMIPPPL